MSACAHRPADSEEPGPPHRRGTHCTECHRTWPTVYESHCADCHEHFMSPRAAQAHRVDGECHPPGTLMHPSGRPLLARLPTMWGGTWVLVPDREPGQGAAPGHGAPSGAQSPSEASCAA